MDGVGWRSTRLPIPGSDAAAVVPLPPHPTYEKIIHIQMTRCRQEEVA